MKTLLSVVIATKNRETYCIEAIKSILNYKDKRVEIAVADNSATTLVKEFVETLNSPSVKYQYNPAEISSIDNFNAAMNLATGEYVILIGDDDSILPTAITTAVWARENSVDSVCSKNTAIYYWPDSCEQYKEGHLSIPPSIDRKTAIDVRKELEKLVEHGIQHYLMYPLPKTYHGLVKKEVLNEIKEKTGHFYGGLSPDIYSCIAVACTAKNHYIIEMPLSIAGVCSVSTTADNIKGTHSGSLEGIPHFKNRGPYEWDTQVPRYYSVNTIWAESGLKALKDFNEKELLQKFNPYFMMAQAKVNNSKFIPKIIASEHEKYRTDKNISKIEFSYYFAKAYTIIVKNKLKTIIKSKKQKADFYTQNYVKDIQEAISIYKMKSE